jgi:hypothetical protein
MSFSVRVEPGRYFAGLSRPFFVTRGAVEERAHEEGFRSLIWHERGRERPPVDPALDPKLDDDWEEWVQAEYAGPPRVMTIPARPAWIVRGTTSSQAKPSPVHVAPAPEPPKTTTPTRPHSSAAWAVVAGIGLVLLAVARKVFR